MQHGWREYKNFAKVLFIVFVWWEVQKAVRSFFQPLKDLWHEMLVFFGVRPCCNNPRLEILGFGRATSARCLNCGYVRTGVHLPH